MSSRQEQPKRLRWAACVIGVILALPVATGCRRSAGNRPQTIILITLDTTRADHLGCYGYTRPTSPNIDRFAADATVYDHAVAPATWTLPSHVSLFTGKFTASHGAQYDANGALHLTSAIEGPPEWKRFRVRTIGTAERTLAELLTAAGYTTGGVVAGPWLKRVFGLHRGFDFYDDEHITTENGRPADDVTDRALEWLGDTPGERRFLFVNYFDPHRPLMPPEAFARKFVAEDVLRQPAPSASGTRQRGLYDAEVAFMDHHVGRLFAGLKSRGLYEGAFIILTADHGELLGEHGIAGHGNAPYQEVVHVPLIVKYPGTSAPTGRTDARIQLIDVLPMILDYLAIPLPSDTQGSVPPDLDHPILIESRTLPRLGGDFLAWMDQGKKLIWNSRGNHMLFDLRTDPGEMHNLVDTHPGEVTAMTAALHRYLEGLPPPGPQAPTQQVDRETAEALRNLGYVE